MQINWKRTILRGGSWIIAIGWTLIFSYLLIQPEQQATIHTIVQPAPPSLEREILFTSLHLLTFSFTAWIWCLALCPTEEDQSLLIALGLILLIYGGGAELLQMQIPGRTAQWWDMTANILGILAGIGLWVFGYHLLHRKNTSPLWTQH